MDIHISCLFDSELAEDEQQAVLSILQDDESLHADWANYQLIGDTLRGDVIRLDQNLTARVMTALQDEPQIVMQVQTKLREEKCLPRAPSFLWADFLPRFMQHSSALAVAVAGVAFVAWLVTHHEASIPVVQFAQAEKTILRMEPQTKVQRFVNDEGMQEYLAVHHTYSRGVHLRSGMGHVQMVSGER